MTLLPRRCQWSWRLSGRGTVWQKLTCRAPQSQPSSVAGRKLRWAFPISRLQIVHSPDFRSVGFSASSVLPKAAGSGKVSFRICPHSERAPGSLCCDSWTARFGSGRLDCSMKAPWCAWFWPFVTLGRGKPHERPHASTPVCAMAQEMRRSAAGIDRSAFPPAFV